ncbi:Scr1 family TA system antitoxin-like transcriptional regulator [Nonomuraea glycinis]|uniref:Scr1 family TA system antitoxin-like transcriptional regulator n=1 Tax=Nonomuraea glycinis TaxID=2047744 RepID=UPI0033AFF6A8
MDTLADRLTAAMRRMGINDRDLADLINSSGVSISHAYIVQLRKGQRTNPTLEHLRALAVALAVPVWWLIGEDDPAGDLPFTALSSPSRIALAHVLELARRADRLPPLGGPAERLPGPAEVVERPRPRVQEVATHPYQAHEVRQAFTGGRMPANRVGGRLQALRKVAGLSVSEVELVIGEGRLSGVEAGTVVPPEPVLRTLLSTYGLTDYHQVELFIAAARGDLDGRWWWGYFQTMPLWVVVLLDMEDQAELIRTWFSDGVPPLLQTSDYTRAQRQAAHFPDTAAQQVRLVVDLMLKRQARLRDREMKLWAVVQESALLDDMGDVEVQLGQIDHLIDLCKRPHVSLQVSQGRRKHYRPRGGSFSLMRVPQHEGPDVVWLPALTEDLLIDDATRTMEYSMAYARLCTSACRPQETPEVLTGIRNRIVRDLRS